MSDSFEFVVDEIVETRENVSIQLVLQDEATALETNTLFLTFASKEESQEYKVGSPVKVSIRPYRVLELAAFNSRKAIVL